MPPCYIACRYAALLFLMLLKIADVTIDAAFAADTLLTLPPADGRAYAFADDSFRHDATRCLRHDAVYFLMLRR